MTLSLTSHSTDDTIAIGRAIGSVLEAGSVVLLEGELGSGKTHMAKGLYLGAGGTDTDHVTSPSYTLVNEYTGARLPVHHVDLYRLERREQLLAMEFEDFLWCEDGISIVEWPRWAAELVEGDDVVKVEFGAVSESVRTITVDAPDHRLSALEEALESCL